MLLGAVAVPILASASPLSLYQQRQIYRQALDHLTAGRAAEFEQARAVLDDYVLAPYLDYYLVQTRLASMSDPQMHEFQARHGGLPAAGILYHRWLKYLGSRAQWQRLLDNYRTSIDPELRCYRGRAHPPSAALRPPTDGPGVASGQRPLRIGEP